MPDADPARRPDTREMRRAFAGALSEALRKAGLPLSRVQTRLEALGTPVTIATLSYWQSGRSLPSRKNSLRAVANLETIVGVPPGTLTSLLVPRGSAGNVLGNAWTSAFLNRALAEFGLSWDIPLRALSVEVDVHVATDGRIPSVGVRRTVRALDQPVGRLPLMLISDTPPAPQVVARSGFVVGRDFRDNLNGISVSELVLERVLMPGEATTLECDILGNPNRPPENGYEWGLPYECDRFRLTIDFEGTPPAKAVAYGLEGFSPQGVTIFRRDLPVVDERLQFELHDPGTGVFGCLWQS